MSGEAITPGTPLPWVAHSAFYPHGTKGDIFAKDARDVRDCTPICRVVRPQSKRKNENEKPPIDALHSIAERKQDAPVIEANAAYIVHCANEYPALKAKADDLARYLAIFLGEDDRFQTMIGGNPYAVDSMMDDARQALAAYRESGQ